ncbi:hypothetical protein ACQP2F_11950 [Actinoplanes sp. CA-030573]|uniref:hypothetical protein n=1 Tax=Actinoplanes sp. CA-030573 TaxID=3239898 RepID=UPI003D92DBF3
MWFQELIAEASSPWMFPTAGDDAGTPDARWTASSHDVRFSLVTSHESVWVIACLPNGAGVALRAAYCPVGELSVEEVEPADTGARLRIDSAIGVFRTEIDLPDPDAPLLHVTTALTPREPLTMPYWPRDLIPLGDGPTGRLYAQQEGLRTGCVHFSVTRPFTGTVFYFQNLTALNDYAEQTHTSLADVVGGSWPEMGFALPGSADRYIAPGRETVLSDAYLALFPDVPEDDTAMAEQFLESMARILVVLPRRPHAYVHWPDIAEKALRDLAESPKCSEVVEGSRFLNAYVEDRETPPESMVQLAVLLPLLEYAAWRGDDIPLARELRDGLPGFFDRKAGVFGRWLISEKDRLDGSEPHKKPGTMDSWYLYHAMLNLARLARHGDESARALFVDSLDYAIAVAHRFDYRWPVLYNLYTLDVEVSRSGDGEPGESDVAALFAHVMLEAHELTGEDRFVAEARAAAERLTGLGMKMFYQANVTLFGAAALLRLAELTGEDRFRRMTYVAMASAFNNTWLWECDYGYASSYPTFLAMFPLRGAPYIAVLEAIEAFSAVEYYLRLAGGELPTWLTVLLPEFRRGLIERAAFYYPQNLPPEAVSDKPRTGSIDRELWIPLEDLYEGWEQAGQVGQEVYGAGAAFAFLPRQYRRIEGAGFIVFVDYPIGDLTVTGEREATLRVVGDPRFACRLRIMPDGPDPLPDVTVTVTPAVELPGHPTPEGHCEYELRGDQTATIHWEPSGTGASR